MQADWIAVDWGTSRLRAWAMGPDGPLAQAASDKGMNGLAPEAFEPALLELVAPWLAPDRPMPVVACGMVGARQGWIEAPYLEVPCAPAAPSGAIAAPARDPRLRVRILPGLCQQAPADVMRGEETQIAGLLAGEPGFAGLVCLPGTHTKWVTLDGGRVTGFRTFMTGELFALLAQNSVLRHSLGGTGWDEASFLAALEETRAHPARLSAALFSIRAQSLLSGLTPPEARARLSGLLIGAELAGIEEADAPPGRIAVIGADGASAPYLAALRHAGHDPVVLDTAAATLAGLSAAHNALEAQET
ncbi:2-dehydro-3-deoxygalactonokinase [Actibacterium sp. MT2.3-13A]|uniref:2-dehydro-3-deoxygalactonokinase n=1 Tax=Actibacterium sp. MT2.3-13A TaxID=2828332 RepID=UPI001BA57CE7|nr:2-dehydro-3-deoxygalactonokinase [Actibacterium sp. MT2.3-13A]